MSTEQPYKMGWPHNCMHTCLHAHGSCCTHGCRTMCAHGVCMWTCSCECASCLSVRRAVRCVLHVPLAHHTMRLRCDAHALCARTHAPTHARTLALSLTCAIVSTPGGATQVGFAWLATARIRLASRDGIQALLQTRQKVSQAVNI